jgi:LacI family transcriptional regulator
LNAQGIRLIVSKLSDEKLTSQQLLPAILREFACDGLLINYTDHIPKEMIAMIQRYRIPSIWINSRQAADCVYYDDFGGAMAATQRLISLGHRRIAYLDFTDHEGAHYSRIDRHQGYLQAMRSAGIEAFDRERLVGVPVTDRLDCVCELLSKPDRPTAILTYDAGERVLYAASLAKLRVPEDLSVIAFTNEPKHEPSRGEGFFGRNLTRLRVPADQAGHKAVEMLFQKIANPKQKLPAAVVPLVLESGETCAAVGAAVKE